MDSLFLVVHRDSSRGGESDFPDLEFDLGFRVQGSFLVGVNRDSCGRGESVPPESVRDAHCRRIAPVCGEREIYVLPTYRSESTSSS